MKGNGEGDLKKMNCLIAQTLKGRSNYAKQAVTFLVTLADGLKK